MRDGGVENTLTGLENQSKAQVVQKTGVKVYKNQQKFGKVDGNWTRIAILFGTLFALIDFVPSYEHF